MRKLSGIKSGRTTKEQEVHFPSAFFCPLAVFPAQSFTDPENASCPFTGIQAQILWLTHQPKASIKKHHEHSGFVQLYDTTIQDSEPNKHLIYLFWLSALVPVFEPPVFETPHGMKSESEHWLPVGQRMCHLPMTEKQPLSSVLFHVSSTETQYEAHLCEQWYKDVRSTTRTYKSLQVKFEWQ